MARRGEGVAEAAQLRDARGEAARCTMEVELMLILTRRTGETLMVGNEVTVTVLGVKGNQVRLGVNAPRSVPVHREEIYRRIQQEDAAAARLNKPEEGAS